MGSFYFGIENLTVSVALRHSPVDFIGLLQIFLSDPVLTRIVMFLVFGWQTGSHFYFFLPLRIGALAFTTWETLFIARVSCRKIIGCQKSHHQPMERVHRMDDTTLESMFVPNKNSTIRWHHRTSTVSYWNRHQPNVDVVTTDRCRPIRCTVSLLEERCWHAGIASATVCAFRYFWLHKTVLPHLSGSGTKKKFCGAVHNYQRDDQFRCYYKFCLFVHTSLSITLLLQ